MTDEKKAPAKAEKVEKKTALEWAHELGHFTAKQKHVPESRDLYSPKFSAADVIHGWSLQAHHYQTDPFVMSQADFEKAIEAGQAFPTVKPHDPAVAPYYSDKYKSFKPLKARAAKE